MPDPESRWQRFLKGGLFNAVIAVAAASSTILIRENGSWLYDLISRKASPFSAQILVVASVLGLGLGAHRFKKRNKSLYGIVEIFFGGTSAGSIVWGVSQMPVMVGRWAALAGCVYVVARGFNNYYEAKQSELKSIAPMRTATPPSRPVFTQTMPPPKMEVIASLPVPIIRSHLSLLEIGLIAEITLEEVTPPPPNFISPSKTGVVVTCPIKITNLSNDATIVQEFRLEVQRGEASYTGIYSRPLTEQKFGLTPGREIKRGIPVAGPICFVVEQILSSVTEKHLIAGHFKVMVRDGFENWSSVTGVTELGPKPPSG